MEHLIPRGSTRYLPWTDLNIFYKFFKTVIKNQNSIITYYMKLLMPLYKYNSDDKNIGLIDYLSEDTSNFNPYIHGDGFFFAPGPEFILETYFQTWMGILEEKYKIYTIPKNIDVHKVHYLNPIKLKKKKEW